MRCGRPRRNGLSGELKPLAPEEDVRCVGPYIRQKCDGCGARNDDGGDWQGADFVSCSNCGQTLCPLCEPPGGHRCDAIRASAHLK
jgi:ribosomal protein S27E